MKSKLVRNFVIICSLALLVICLVIVILVKTFNSNEVFLTIVPKSYCYVSKTNEEKDIELYVYISNKKSFVTKVDKVMHSYIRSCDRADELLINCESIIDLNTKVKINNKSYYLYNFIFNVPLKSSEEYDLSIPHAIISMDFPEDTVEFNIGSFYFYKIPYFGDNEGNISVSRIKGIVNNVGLNKSLVGVEIGFRNLTKNEITIKNIELLDKTVYASKNEIIELNEEISSNEQISKLLGYDYDINDGTYLDECDLKISGYETIDFLVPLKYQESYVMNSVAFKIVYELDNNIYTFYTDNICLFNDINYFVDESKLEVISYDFNY